MDNEDYCAEIKKMNMAELFSELMKNPDCLTDSYYRDTGNAIRARYEELTKEE